MWDSELNAHQRSFKTMFTTLGGPIHWLHRSYDAFMICNMKDAEGCGMIGNGRFGTHLNTSPVIMGGRVLPVNNEVKGQR